MADEPVIDAGRQGAPPPLLSIVTVSYQSAATLGDTLASVAQAIAGAAAAAGEVEHWVIDGGSRDGTLDLLQRHRHAALRWTSEPDAGIYDAMNKGLAAADGDYVWFLNADDMVADPQALGALLAELRSREADVVLCDVDMVDPADTGRVLRRFAARSRWPRFGLGWHPPHPGFVARRRLLRDVGGFDLGYRIAADYDLMLRVLDRPAVRVVDLPRTLTHMRAGGLSNAGLRPILRANRECAAALRRSGRRFVWLGIACKLARKLAQRLAPPLPRLDRAARAGAGRPAST